MSDELDEYKRLIEDRPMDTRPPPFFGFGSFVAGCIIVICLIVYLIPGPADLRFAFIVSGFIFAALTLLGSAFLSFRVPPGIDRYGETPREQAFRQQHNATARRQALSIMPAEHRARLARIEKDHPTWTRDIRPLADNYPELQQ